MAEIEEEQPLEETEEQPLEETEEESEEEQLIKNQNNKIIKNIRKVLSKLSITKKDRVVIENAIKIILTRFNN